MKKEEYSIELELDKDLNKEEIENRLTEIYEFLLKDIIVENDLFTQAEELAKVRERLCKDSPLCPQCKTDQVQLIEWIEGPEAEWKCRHCRHKFKQGKI